MGLFVYRMLVTGKFNSFYSIRISNDGQHVNLRFDPENKILEFSGTNKISSLLRKNEYQFRKILHIKKPDTWFEGFNIDFVIRDGKDVGAYNDLDKILVLDKRKQPFKNYVTDKGKKGISELYIDGSYMQERKKGGYAIVVKHRNGNYDLHTYTSAENSSCLIELQAAIKGLELLNRKKLIRIVTDSQYVRKGLTEWIINWKLNNWTTANGSQVKNIEYWMKFDSLTDNRYIEFAWIKSHSGHFENTMADLYAKDMTHK